MNGGDSLVFFFFTVFFLFTTFHSDAQHRDDLEALIAFKANVRDPLRLLTGWTLSASPSAPCDWRGVSCYNGRVAELSLPRFHLSGRVTYRILDLTQLRRLNLRSNNFSGTIPPLSQCAFLRVVFLQDNSFSGDLPFLAGNLTSLDTFDVSGNLLTGSVSWNLLPPNLLYFDISFNSLSGSIRAGIANSSRLRFLNLSHNQFSGQIPAELGRLQLLHYLHLDSNLLAGPIPSVLGNCTSLAYLTIRNNSLAGTLPAAIAALPDILQISLDGNQLTGSVPPSFFCNVTRARAHSLQRLELGFNDLSSIMMNSYDRRNGCFSSLQVLDLRRNEISGEFPLWITSSLSSSLRVLDLSGNLFSGGIPKEINRMTRLEELRMADNSLEGEIPAEISECVLLRVLDLEGNRLTGDVPSLFGMMQTLTELVLRRNRFSGTIPEGLSNAAGLQVLNLAENRLAGRLPAGMMFLGNLSVLDVAGNSISGDIPEEIGNLNRLEVLNMSGNVLSGVIPRNLGVMYSLRVLDLSKQNLTGELPFELSGLPNIEHVALQENMLSGEIPGGFGSLLSLRSLNLSSNSFSGRVPPNLGFLNSIGVLSISQNRISGIIPPELGNCSDLRVLDLRLNDLTGGVPDEISKCSSLTSLLLGGNRLSGEIPDSISNLSNLVALDLSANDFTGEIPGRIASIATLKRFNVTRNDLEGEIPPALGSRFDDPSVFGMNGNLCGKPLARKCGGRNRISRIAMYALAGSGIFLMSLCCCFYVFSFWKWRRSIRPGAAGGEKKRSPARRSSGASAGRGSSNAAENGGQKQKIVMFKNKITLAETMEATRNFDEESVLSRTRFGLTFKASYPDGSVLAVHRLPPGSSISDSNFRKEAEFIGRLKHKNLTVLRGYCAGSADTRLLLYDYMPNGNLAKLLQEASSQQDANVLNWPMRHLIALGIARGLAFLHSAGIVHGNLKAQIVSFDADFEPHLADFCLDRFGASSQADPSSSSTVRLSGYSAPEAAVAGEFRKASDTYSFGVLLLELLTGKKPQAFGPDDDIVRWVKRQLQKGLVTELLEVGLLDLNPDSSEWEGFLLGLKVGLLCTGRDPTDRPTMSDAVFMLEGCRGAPDVPSSAEPTSHHSPA